jgi:4-hydroxybenzoate polyprenyltransferase
MINILNTFRVKYWWNHVVPTILLFVYIYSFFNSYEFLKTIQYFILFLISIIGTAAYGYLLNDVTDIKDDLKSGKQNHASKLQPNIRYILLISTLIVAFVPLFWLPINILNLTFFLFQLHNSS